MSNLFNYSRVKEEEGDMKVDPRVVAHRATSLTKLEELSKSRDPLVREEVAMNSHTSATVLRDLSKDSEEVVRQSVANNPKTPIDVLDKLGKDDVIEIRWSVAENPSTSATTIFRLSEEHGYVREVAMRHPNYDWNKYLDDFATIQDSREEKDYSDKE